MKFKEMISNLPRVNFQFGKGKLKRISVSYLSIFLVLMVILGSTVAWFTINDTADVRSTDFTMESVTGLRVNDGEDLENHININNMRLAEASSVDGRNMYFPTTGTFTSNTSEMVFREGNTGDKNVNYCYRDFTLTGDSGVTYVYVKSYSVEVDRKDSSGNIVKESFDGLTKLTRDENGVPIAQETHAECPIRIALITDSATTPMVIDPSALISNYANTYNAVDMIDGNGKAVTKTSVATSFSDYYYTTGRPIFTLNGSNPVTVAFVVWIEGTSDACDQYVDQNIKIDIELESNWTDMDYITFVDDTIPDHGSGNDHWVGGDNNFVVMSYKDINSGDRYKSVVMRKDGEYSWIAPIPKNIVTDISFYRYSKTSETIFNSWHTYEGVNGQLNKDAKAWAEALYGNKLMQEYRTSDGTASGTKELVYHARRGNGYGSVSETDPEVQKKRLSPCIGQWGNYQGSKGDPDTPVDPDTPIGGEVEIKIYLGQVKSWVTNLVNQGYTLYIVLDDKSKYPMTKLSDDRYEGTVTTEINKSIHSFVVEASYNSQTLPLDMQKPITNNHNHNMSFEMQNDDTVMFTN